MIYISPAEPKMFWVLGEISEEPEQAGVDFMWSSPMGMVGVQRKQFPGDFLASVHDGRLNREYLQMDAALDIKVLMLEGKGNWTVDGELIESWGHRGDQQRRRQWNQTTHRNYLSSVQIIKGVTVQQSQNMHDSMSFIKEFFIWTQKKEHTALDVRPAAQAQGYWDSLSNRDFQRYWLQSMPIIGPKLANNILDHLGFPFSIHVTKEDLMEVEGIGEVRASRIMDMFEKAKEDHA